MRKAASMILLSVLALALLASCTGYEGEALSSPVGQGLQSSMGDGLRSGSFGGFTARGAAEITDPWVGTWAMIDEDVTVILYGDGRIHITTYGESASGTYSISGNRITMTLFHVLYGSMSETVSFRLSGDSLFIDGDELRRR